jgi:hypothetical protein
VDPAEHQGQQECQEPYLPGLEPKTVAQGEVRPHINLLVATVLMPQNMPP